MTPTWVEFDHEFRDLPALPNVAYTRSGQPFSPGADEWVVDGLVGSFIFKFRLFENFSPRMVHCLKITVSWYLQNFSLSHAWNLHSTAVFFHRGLGIPSPTDLSSIELHHVLKFRSTLNVETEWRLAIIRMLLKQMARLRCGIASTEVIDYLSDSRIAGNPKGTSVRTRDPETGMFSDVELKSIQSRVNDAFAAGKLDIYAYALTWLFLAYGPRSVQFAAMKETDLIVSRSKAGHAYALRIPRAKQRDQAVRESFKTRYCSKEIGLILEKVIAHNQEVRSENGIAGSENPMFMSSSARRRDGLDFHMSSGEIARIVVASVSRLTGLNVNPRRFRITLGQRAVDDGMDKYTLAELLDHSDTQSVRFYYEASPATVVRLDRHLAMELAPLAQAFAGVIINDETDASRANDHRSRIYDRSLNDNTDRALGNCGQMSFCGLFAPYACYTCRHFQPWIDGPHEEFLAVLVNDRERMMGEGLSEKIYAIRDRTILAVAEVIQLCSTHREGDTA